MKRLFGGLGIVACLVLSGCAESECTYSDDRCRAAPQTANLLFGRSRDELWLAQLYAGRASWPSVETGSIVEDITFFYEDRNDRQSFYDRFGGGTRQETQSFRTGVWVR